MSEPGHCPFCHSDRVLVKDARHLRHPYYYRRRECQQCGRRYSVKARTETTADGVRVTIEAPTLRLLDRAWRRCLPTLDPEVTHK